MQANWQPNGNWAASVGKKHHRVVEELMLQGGREGRKEVAGVHEVVAGVYGELVSSKFVQ